MWMEIVREPELEVEHEDDLIGLSSILKEVLWVKFDPSASHATEKMCMKEIVNWCSKLHCLILSNFTATAIFNNHHPDRSVSSSTSHEKTSSHQQNDYNSLKAQIMRRHELSICAMAVLRHRQANGAASRAGLLEVWRRRVVGGRRGSPGRSLAAVGPQEHVAVAPAFLGGRQRPDPGLGSGRRRTTPPPRLALGAQGLRSCRPADRQPT
ncbi:hypothetical protein QTO34_001267, partial [Cnephaeus nilssonii]